MSNSNIGDELRFDTPLDNCAMPRWQRKALEAERQLPKTPKSAKTPTHDRFIPNRAAMDIELGHFKLGQSSKENTDAFQSALASSLLGGNTEGSKILAFKSKAPAPREGYSSELKVLYTANKVGEPKPKSTRHIPQQPDRILDAPEMLDDYYLNLLDWSPNNIIAVALGQSVYLWNATTGSIQQLCQTPEQDNYITSVSWIQEGNYLAVGTNNADVQLWDCEAIKQVRNMRGHSARVGALAWNAHILSSGSRDSSIIHHDVRVAQHVTATLVAHQQEVCGLKWSPDGTHLASGGNDNLLNVWEAGRTMPKFTFDAHQAAVKAIAWCPFQSNVLASGGGTADRCIRFWNTQTGSCLNTVDTKSQVCALLWSSAQRELVSSHGFSQNQITVWKYPSMTKQAELTGHTSRVLHLAMSPDGQTVVSGAGDETLRFWKMFPAETKTVAAKKSAASTMMRSIR